MKVFFVNTNKQWGGGEKWHFETALALMKRGHQVAVLSDPRYELYSRASASGLPTIPISVSNLSFLNPLKIRMLAGMLKKEKPDTIILNFSADVKTAGIAAFFAGIRKIIYRRGNARPVKNSLLNRFLFGRIITGVIANSEETKRSILLNNSTLFPHEKIRVFYNGINLEDYDRFDNESLFEPPPGKVVIGSAGRLSNEKGHTLLIEAASKLRKTHENFIVYIAGTGPAGESLKQMIAQEQLEDYVKLTGFTRNIRAFMEGIDFFVLPSLWEGFGYVTIEAMAASKPVIAFRTGSNPEIIIPGITGLLIDDFNTQAMAEAMAAMTDDQALRYNMGINARKRVEECFEMKVIQGQFEEFLSEK